MFELSLRAPVTGRLDWGWRLSLQTHSRVVGRRLHFLSKWVSLFGCSWLKLASNSVNVGWQRDRKREIYKESEREGERDWGRNHWLLWPTSQSYTPSLLFTKFIEREVTQSYPTLCDPMDCSLQGSSVRGIFQARVLAWVAISFYRGSSWPRDQTQVSHIAGRHFTIWATRNAQISQNS